MKNTDLALDLDAIRADQRKIVVRALWALFSLYRLAGRDEQLREKTLSLRGLSDEDQAELLQSMFNSALDPELAEAFSRLPSDEQTSLIKVAD